MILHAHSIPPPLTVRKCNNKHNMDATARSIIGIVQPYMFEAPEPPLRLLYRCARGQGYANFLLMTTKSWIENW